MQTIQEKHLVIMTAYIRGFWPVDCWEPFNHVDGSPSQNPDGFRNFELLKKEVNAIPQDEDIDIDDARKLFLRLRDNGNIVKQTLIRKPTAIVRIGAEPVDPVQNIPHLDVPELRGLMCLEDIEENGHKISKKILSAGGGADRAGIRNELLDKLNERLKYIQTFRIERSMLPDWRPTGTQKEAISFQEPETNNPAINQALSDVLAAIGRYQGRSHSQTAKRREALKEIYNRFVSQVKTVADAEKLGRTIDAQMDKWDSSSIH